eukprot:3458536-Pleurochrysis_carterae.AAC.1
MQKQYEEYALELAGLELTFYKSLVRERLAATPSLYKSLERLTSCSRSSNAPRKINAILHQGCTTFSTAGYADTRGVSTPRKNGSNANVAALRVGQYVRERSTANFLVVCRIYQPLLGAYMPQSQSTH